LDNRKIKVKTFYRRAVFYDQLHLLQIVIFSKDEREQLTNQLKIEALTNGIIERERT
jgi:hypothetical protein